MRRRVGWLALLALWLFVLASLLSFDRADPPGTGVYPVNESTANWCGIVGAGVAHHMYRVFGWPVWVAVGAAGLALAFPALRQSADHLLLRCVGVLLLTAAAAGLNGLLLPGWGPVPDQPGGVIGAVTAIELSVRFGVVGSVLILLLSLGIGAIVALDKYLWTVPAWAWRRMGPAAERARELAGSTVGVAGSAARRSGGAVAALGSMMRRSERVRIRLDDLEDDEELPSPQPVADKKGRRRSGRKVAKAAVAAPEAEEDLADEAYDEEGADEEEESTEVEAKPARGRGRGRRGKAAAAPEPDEGDEDEDELPGAPQVFTQDELREKIARLPVRFAASNRRVATQEDLRDLQNVEELEGYQFPGLDLLTEPEENFSERLEGIVREQAEALESALREYKIKGEVVGIESGPVITLYDVRLAPGTKVSSVQAVSSDIARSLKAVNVRIVPNQVGRDTVGIEVPNPDKERVRLKELMSNSERFASMRLPMFLGKDASGDPLIADLTEMPHMLIAGTTGSGKSVCMNTIIMSFLYTKKPNELKTVLVDPKMVEMSQFKDIPHLMCPVVTEMPKAAAILEWATRKMDERYELLAEAGCRDIASYNEMEWEELRDAFNPSTPEEEARIPRKLPYMVFIIDELADLMMTAKEVEGSIIRIAQKARAVGIHLILATQRPQANVVTGLIKSNMPCRLTFKVASGMDSRIVLDQKGGELLLGQGDMLFLSPRSSKLTRAQGTLVDDKEIRRVVRFMRDVARPTFERQLTQLRSGGSVPEDEDKVLESRNNSSASLQAAQEDPMFDRAVEIVLETKRGSVSLLQRRLAIGYTRASRLIDLMGIAGIIGEHKGSVAREVMISPEQWAQMKELDEEEARRQGSTRGQQTLFDKAEDGSAEQATTESDAPEAGDEADAPPFEPGSSLDESEDETDKSAPGGDDEAWEEGEEEEWDGDEAEEDEEDWEEEDWEEEDPEGEYEEGEEYEYVDEDEEEADEGEDEEETTGQRGA